MNFRPGAEGFLIWLNTLPVTFAPEKAIGERILCGSPCEPHHHATFFLEDDRSRTLTIGVQMRRLYVAWGRKMWYDRGDIKRRAWRHAVPCGAF